MLNLKYVFNRSKRLRKDGRGKLHLRITYERKPYYYDTEILLFPYQWNENKGAIVSHELYDEYNEDLEDYLSKARRFYRQSKKDKKVFRVRKLLEHLSKIDNDQNFFEFCKEINSVEILQLAESTAKKRKDLLNRLESFRSEIYMSDVDIRFVNDFKNWLFSQKSKRGTYLGANYVSSLIVLLKKFVRDARARELIEKDPFVGFKINKTAKVTETLNEEEIEMIWNYKAKGKYKRSRKHILFYIYTGIRFADIITIKPTHFRDGMLRFIAGKTARSKGKEARIPLHLFNNRALDLFNELHPIRLYNNNDLNVNLRHILKELKIDKYLTIHSLRHTFKTVLHERGYPLHIIAEFMAHSSTKTTAGYGNISDNAVMKKC